jgi:hypothetical protein
VELVNAINAPVTTEDETANQAQPTVYSKTELVARAKEIFGEHSEIVIGALHGNDAEQLTIYEVQQKIKDFLERKVS